MGAREAAMKRRKVSWLDRALVDVPRCERRHLAAWLRWTAFHEAGHATSLDAAPAPGGAPRPRSRTTPPRASCPRARGGARWPRSAGDRGADGRRRPGDVSTAGCAAGARRAGRISPTRIARRGSRGNSVCPIYAPTRGREKGDQLCGIQAISQPRRTTIRPKREADPLAPVNLGLGSVWRHR